MISLTIDGRTVQAKEGDTVLSTARDNNIFIPTLCDNESVAPYGACRLCLVEVGRDSGRTRLVTSCLYPVEDGLVVKTDSERIKHNRKLIIEMLLARCPESDVVQNMAKELGVDKTRFKPEEDNTSNNCILCALCTRVCQQVVGVSAISLANRGVTRMLSTPFGEDWSEACIGCGSCAYVCPTHAITIQDANGKRVIKWPHNQMEFQLKKCKVCGMYWAPEKQIEHIAKLSGTKVEEYDVCPNCR